MLWTVAAESTHNHPNPNEAASCPICVVAHTASPAVAASHGTTVFTAVGVFQEEDLIFRPRIESSHLSIRGPPPAL
jgi:hypothetical protein